MFSCLTSEVVRGKMLLQKLVHSKVLSITSLQSRSRRIRVQAFCLWGRKLKKVVKIYHYLMARKVKMKPHLGMNKHGLSSKMTKMKTLLLSFLCTIVSLDETRLACICYFLSTLSPLRGSVRINGESYS